MTGRWSFSFANKKSKEKQSKSNLDPFQANAPPLTKGRKKNSAFQKSKPRNY